MKKLSVLSFLFFMGCVGIPENVKPVQNFKIEKYLDKWYEIVRLDHSFLWILARSPIIDEDIRYAVIEKATASGFDTSKLIFVDHD